MNSSAQLRSPVRIGRGIAEAAVERARLTVVPRRRTRSARMPFVMLVSLVLLGGVIGLLLFNTSMQQASFAATALEDQANTLTAREQTLQMELEVLRDPQRVAEHAQNLGMVPAANPVFLRLSDGKVLGERVAATPANRLRVRPLPPVKPAVLTPAPIVHEVLADNPVLDNELADDSGADTDGTTARSDGRHGRNDANASGEHARR
jgi:cell division protein FtsB